MLPQHYIQGKHIWWENGSDILDEEKGKRAAWRTYYTWSKNSTEICAELMARLLPTCATVPALFL